MAVVKKETVFMTIWAFWWTIVHVGMLFWAGMIRFEWWMLQVYRKKEHPFSCTCTVPTKVQWLRWRIQRSKFWILLRNTAVRFWLLLKSIGLLQQLFAAHGSWWKWKSLWFAIPEMPKRMNRQGALVTCQECFQGSPSKGSYNYI